MRDRFTFTLLLLLLPRAHAKAILREAATLQDREAATLQGDPNCGGLNQLACYSTDAAGNEVHSCFSDGKPTMAPQMTADALYTCHVCGGPEGPACECTNDNEAVATSPCEQGLTHWCLGVGFEAVASPDGLWKCEATATVPVVLADQKKPTPTVVG